MKNLFLVLFLGVCFSAQADTCKDALIKKGWSLSYLKHCNSINQDCAFALINKGWNPGYLPLCKNVLNGCAVAMLNDGWSPTNLNSCLKN